MNVTTLEQSRKLKELGAPQDTKMHYYDGENYPGVAQTEREWREYDGAGDKEAAAYTLEELIEWLVGGKRNTFYLEYDDEWSVYETEPPKDYKWHARYYPNTPVGFYDVHGATPLEAVYNLALAINPLEEKEA